MLEQWKRHFVEASFGKDYLWNTLSGSCLMASNQCCNCGLPFFRLLSLPCIMHKAMATSSECSITKKRAGQGTELESPPTASPLACLHFIMCWPHPTRTLWDVFLWFVAEGCSF